LINQYLSENTWADKQIPKYFLLHHTQISKIAGSFKLAFFNIFDMAKFDELRRKAKIARIGFGQDLQIHIC